MTTPDGPLWDEESAPLDYQVMDSMAEVDCPYCGETTAVSIDPGSGARQDYFEDCHVCCRPWRVRVQYDDSGAAEVFLEMAS